MPVENRWDIIMTGNIINGKQVAAQLKTRIRTAIEQGLLHNKKKPGLAVILVGDDPASEIYVRHKRAACEEVGINSFYHALPTNTNEKIILELINTLNNDPTVDGILVQSPLPKHINADALYELIDPKKDVDGFHPYNVGRLMQRRPLLRPCTPYGIILLLNSIDQMYKGKHAVIVGASNIVGRPMALELLIAGATTTICHRFTNHLEHYVSDADILISAVGKQNLIRGSWIKEGATVIDVGQIRLENGQLTGDVEYVAAKERAKWITPVPGGVGPMTVAILMHNTLIASGYPALF